MHEASLMKDLLSIVDRTVCDGGMGPVRVVHLKIGEMAGVSADALQFAFDVMAAETAAAHAALEIERVPLSMQCRTCGARSSGGDFVFVCAACGSPEMEILAGREMEVDYILVGDDEVEAHDPKG